MLDFHQLWCLELALGRRMAGEAKDIAGFGFSRSYGFRDSGIHVYYLLLEGQVKKIIPDACVCQIPANIVYASEDFGA